MTVDGTETKGYNGFGQTVSFAGSGVSATYAYRSDGLRHSKTVTRGQEQSARVHLWDGQNMVAEIGATGAIVARYLRGANLIAREQDGALQYYLHNAHGDVTERTDNLGTVLRRYKYDAFGNEQSPELLDSNPFRFCGEYFDAELGEIYLRARYYDPRTGRFGAEDSARDGLNWYTYCNGNPVLYVDYSGAAVFLAVLAALALAGILAGCEARSLPASSSSQASSGTASIPKKSSSIPAFINPLGPPDLNQVPRQVFEGETMGLPEGVSGATKRYEDFSALTDPASHQVAMQKLAYTDELGFRRINVEGLDSPAYMAALGTYYTGGESKGAIFEVELENGFSFYLVAGDTKADVHTNETNQYTILGNGITKENSDIIEFIMDTRNPIANKLRYHGVLNFVDEYKFMYSPITKITRFNQTVLK